MAFEAFIVARPVKLRWKDGRSRAPRERSNGCSNVFVDAIRAAGPGSSDVRLPRPTTPRPAHRAVRASRVRPTPVRAGSLDAYRNDDSSAVLDDTQQLRAQPREFRGILRLQLQEPGGQVRGDRRRRFAFDLLDLALYGFEALHGLLRLR